MGKDKERGGALQSAASVYYKPQRDPIGHQAGGFTPHMETQVCYKEKLTLREQAVGGKKDGEVYLPIPGFTHLPLVLALASSLLSPVSH